ncbi:GNAT family N-acetyltransferase [Clostridium sp.]|uniref:GNAT family N-acetyltransferase n=1 Tax=Clostridium sp. TaxID=1506 RepID=UPI00346488CA
MNEKITLEVALEKDAEEIRDMMIVVEEDETNRWYDNGERPFIPGYDSTYMQRYHMWDKKYYKIIYDNALAGVLLISYTGREHARVDRLYINPGFQNKGIGSKVIALMEEMYPRVRIWTLDTSQKSIRNHHFYEKNGYIQNERYYCKIISDSTNDSHEFYTKKVFNDKNLRRCNIRDIDIYEVNMKNAKFTNVNLEKSIYQNSNLSKTRFTNIDMSNSVLGDSNLNKIEICNASLGDAYLHDINLGAQEKKIPLTMERCELNNSRIVDSDLQNLSICNCNIEGMTIDGVLVSDLMKIYKEALKKEDNNI